MLLPPSLFFFTQNYYYFICFYTLHTIRSAMVHCAVALPRLVVFATFSPSRRRCRFAAVQHAPVRLETEPLVDTRKTQLNSALKLAYQLSWLANWVQLVCKGGCMQESRRELVDWRDVEPKPPKPRRVKWSYSVFCVRFLVGMWVRAYDKIWSMKYEATATNCANKLQASYWSAELYEINALVHFWTISGSFGF